MQILTPEFSCLATDDELIEQITTLNAEYRKGSPLVSDTHFDALFAELESRQPENPLVKRVQPALFDSKGRIAHTRPMLSTEKAYEAKDIKSWLDKIAEFTGESVGTGKTLIRISPKFDGCAGRYNPDSEHKLVTRGDGMFGNDFSNLIAHGLKFVGNAANNVGEVICDEEYFQTHLKNQGVAHPRNFVAGLISADVISPIGVKALNEGAVHFVAYNGYSGNFILELRNVLGALSDIEASIIANCPYRTDGIILQVDDDKLFDSMGHGSRSHHGQIAKKMVGEPVEAIITGIKWQLGRSGRVNPVINIEPTEMSGAMVSSVTAHHAGNVRNQGIGQGGVGSFLRSGEVIPFLVKIHKKASPEIPKHCPCCNSELIWQSDFLYCQNDDCTGRLAAQLEFLAKTLGMDLIGGKAAEKLAVAGINCIGLLSITEDVLQAAGFGAGQSKNILAEILRIKTSSIEDFKVLASVGIHTLGRRASKNLLSEYPLNVLLDGISTQQVSALSGFADTKAIAITEGIEKNKPLLNFMVDFFDDIVPSKLDIAADAPLVGMNVVFTGTLSSGTRNEMESNAEALGAKVQKSVNKLTSMLICGSGVGASKTSKAAALGVNVISEADYLALIA